MSAAGMTGWEGAIMSVVKLVRQFVSDEDGTETLEWVWFAASWWLGLSPQSS